MGVRLTMYFKKSDDGDMAPQHLIKALSAASAATHTEGGAGSEAGQAAHAAALAAAAVLKPEVQAVAVGPSGAVEAWRVGHVQVGWLLFSQNVPCELHWLLHGVSCTHRAIAATVLVDAQLIGTSACMR